jgi:hypothetical protein
MKRPSVSKLHINGVPPKKVGDFSFEVSGNLRPPAVRGTKKVYRNALREIETLMAAAANSPEGIRLDRLTSLVESYERTHSQMDPAQTAQQQPT